MKVDVQCQAPQCYGQTRPVLLVAFMLNTLPSLSLTLSLMHALSVLVTVIACQWEAAHLNLEMVVAPSLL